MADKKTALAIEISLVDKATAKIKAINARLDAATKPVRDFKKALGDLREKSGLDDVIGGFQGVGSAVAGVLAKIAVIGGVAAAAVAGLFHLVDGFDQLGDKAEELGVGVDFLAQMRYAAERSGAEVEQLDSGLKAFTSSLGQARAGTGRMTAFLKLVSPTLLTQLKATKNNEQAFDLLANAMAKIEDPAKRAAFAQKTLGDASLAPLLARGAKGVKELRDRYLELAGSQEGAVGVAGKVDDSMKDLKASTDGIKAALVEGLAPALKIIVDQLREWLQGHRGDIKEWAAELGQKLPAAVQTLVGYVRNAVSTISGFLDSGWKLKALLGVIAAVILGPVISAIASLGIALLTNPIGLIIAGIAGGAALLIKYWEPISQFFSDLWDGITEMFSAAWDRIKAIVDKVVDAVDTVIGAAKSIGDKVFGGGVGGLALEAASNEQGNLVSQAQAAIAAQGGRTETKLTVDFANAPRGTRVRADPQSTADVDLSVGYQLGTP